jgi:tetratricopeptide (TPR) repeat protein
MSNFFEDPFETPVAEIGEGYQQFLFHQAGFDLTALGRLREAIEPMQTALEMAVAQRQGMNSLRAAHNLSELHLTLGQIPQAVARAEESIDFATRARDYWGQWSNRSHLAYVLYQAGDRDRSLQLFREAEDEEPKWLVSLPAFRYFDVLLDQGRDEEVRERAVYAISMAKQQNWPFDIALVQLCMARAELLASQRDHGIHYVPHGLLARASLRRVSQDFAGAKRDLDEVMRLSKRSQMKLFECDAHLEYARLHTDLGERAKTRTHLKEANNLIIVTGYHRRDSDLATMGGGLRLIRQRARQRGEVSEPKSRQRVSPKGPT